MTTRTELIARLKTAASQYYLLEYRDLMSVAADMLEADEQGMKDAFASGMSCRPASVQERDKLKGEVLSLRSLLNHEYQKVTEPFPLAFHELCADLAKTKESRDTYQREADKLAAENKVLRDALCKELVDELVGVVCQGGWITHKEQIMNNEPAFPHTERNGANYGGVGMTLRDYFAAKAMAALITSAHYDSRQVFDAAKEAYFLADAMLNVRSKS